MDVLGVDKLIKDFEKIEAATSAKLMRNAAVSATNPVVRKMKAAAPIGSDGHFTYKGRLVAPGFLKRSIAKESKLKGGRATVTIGVKKEAFYGVAFLDDGKTITQRRSKGKPTKKIKPYKLKGHNFFNKVFEDSQDLMVDEFGKQLRKRIDKI